MPRHNHPKHFNLQQEDDNEPTYAIDYVSPRGKELRIEREKSRMKNKNKKMSFYGKGKNTRHFSDGMNCRKW